MKKLLLFFLTLTTINQVVLPNERSSLRLLSGLGLVLGSILILRTYTYYGTSSLSQLFKGGLPGNCESEFPSLTDDEHQKAQDIFLAHCNKDTGKFNPNELTPSEKKLVKKNLPSDFFPEEANNYDNALVGYAMGATLLGVGVGGLLIYALLTPSTDTSKD